MIGKTLGHYQITSQLGKGGMGEVFQARDQVLGRDVADPEGKRFLMMKEAAPAGKPASATDSRKIVIVLNWLEELKQRVPKK